MDWSSRRKDYGRPLRNPINVNRYKAEATRVVNKVTKSSLGSSYAEAVRGSDIGSRTLDSNGFRSEKPEFKESLEVVKWDEKAHDNSWLKFCAVGVLK